ncbi:MAG: hypothetical protein NZ561_07345 [Phycisphaerae bacterium]|nr:hypothetical protein [Phycisphaerae bacterium]MDW8262316.1 hypothetical protein [Phycisphaerales bacterium]
MTLWELIDEIPLSSAELVYSVVCPALITLSILGLARLFPMRGAGWAVPVAIAVAFAVSYRLINNAAAAFPPASAGDWIFALALPIGIAGAIPGLFRLAGVARMVFAAVVLGATMFCLMQPAAATRNPGEWWLLWALNAGVLIVCFVAADAAVRNDHTLLSMIGLAGILAGACLLIQMSGSIKWSLQAGSAVAAGFTSILAIWLGFPRQAVAGGLVLPLLCLVGGLLAVSIEPLFMYVKVHHALLIASGVPLLGAARFLRVGPTRPWLGVVIRLGLPCLPVLLALVLAGAQALADLRDSGPSAGDYLED